MSDLLESLWTNRVAVLAVWGAVLSTVALTWNVRRDLKNRPKIKLVSWVGRVYPPPPKGDVLYVEIINAGPRPVTISDWGADFKGTTTRALFKPRNLPRRLEESDRVQEYADFERIRTDGHRFKRIYAWDTAGKEWELDRKSLREINEQL